MLSQEKSKFKIDKQILKKRILPTILISVLIPLIICLSIPFEVYANNLDEFLFTASNILPMLFLMFFTIFSVIFLILFFLPEKAYKIMCALTISFALVLFLQSNYLNATANSLAGDNLAITAPSTFMLILNTSIWIIIPAVAVVLAIIKDKFGIMPTIATIISIIILATQLITPISCILTNNKIFLSIDERLSLSGANESHKILTNEYLKGLSTSDNIYYFCIDRFDEDYAENAYQKYPGIYDNLTGFTWFQDNISIYSHTYPAVTNMLTLSDYDAEIARSEYLNQAYLNNQTLSVLADNDYQINLHTQSFYAYTDACYFDDYVQNAKSVSTYGIKNSFMLTWNMLKLSFFRVSPLILKNLYIFINSNSCNTYVQELDENNNEKFSLDMKEVCDFVNTTSVKTTDNKLFNFIHVEGCHDLVYDENWNKVGLSFNKDISIAVKSSFMIIDKYIEAMKQAGVYDNATIIITGDHGKDNTKPYEEGVLTALFVKPSNSSAEPLQISQAQTSHDNIWATIVKSANINTNIDFGKSVFEIPENVDQTRRHVFHTYTSTLDEYTYQITGSGRNFDNWEIVGHKFYNKSLMD